MTCMSQRHVTHNHCQLLTLRSPRLSDQLREALKFQVTVHSSTPHDLQARLSCTASRLRHAKRQAAGVTCS